MKLTPVWAPFSQASAGPKIARQVMDAVAETFRQARDRRHSAVIHESLAILRRRFTQDDETE